MKERHQHVAPKSTKPATKVSQVKSKNLHIAKVNQEMQSNCPDIQLIDPKNISSRESLAHNIHYRKDGEVFRVRVFLEDGNNGSFQKLVHYKEDKDGFPHILPLPKGKEREPSAEYLKSFYAGAEILHDEKDYRLELKDGREISISEINGKIVKLNSEQDDCLIEKE
ncbi:MAG: hypothetical protein CME70_22035 [Halobacteriovorax sp.]|nr:hypothetical protein [Halobacteriovorax sp.]|tara:strand:+ start:163322 stop:163822 length:501 start_codon:yes stop_codon:yes gene_type:complete